MYESLHKREEQRSVLQVDGGGPGLGKLQLAELLLQRGHASTCSRRAEKGPTVVRSLLPITDLSD